MKRSGIKFLAALAALIILPSLSYGQANKIEFIKDSLPNGLQVIYHIDKSAPVVSTIVHYRVGSRDEDPARTGFAHFFEHLMFEATSDIPRASIDKYVQRAGGTLNAHTSFDETVYKFTVPAHQVKLPLWIEAQRMRKLLVENTGVETQRGVVKEERKMRNDNAPYGTLFEKMAGYMFEGGSYAWTPIGSEQHIDKATIAEFKEFYDTFYQPNNATLVIAGDFDLGQAKDFVKTYFGGLKRAPEPKRPQFQLKPLKKEVREVVEDDKATLPGLFIGYRGPAMGSADYYAMSLLSDILAGGESSRLYQRLVDKEQVAVQSFLSPFALENSGMMFMGAIPSPGKDVKEVEKIIFDEISKVVKSGITDEELKKAKNIKEAEFVYGKKGTLEKAMALAQYNSYFGDPAMINTEIDQYLKVTKEDILNAAKKYFDTDKRVILVYMPKAQG